MALPNAAYGTVGTVPSKATVVARRPKVHARPCSLRMITFRAGSMSESSPNKAFIRSCTLRPAKLDLSWH
jgi:hypothetical protein